MSSSNFYKNDWQRYYKREWSFKSNFSIITSKVMRYVYFGRKQAAAKNPLLKKLYGLISKSTGKSMGNEMGFEHIESGLLLSHPYAITVNSGVHAGENLTLFKGCTIGSVRGNPKKEGLPQIGDRVTICCNAMVCGNIKIGNDVLIAANAFVDFDVPDNSVVVGNPGVIHHKENPSKYYI